ncbi:MAG: aminopeptidase [Patescibacteria group bacterium]
MYIPSPEILKKYSDVLIKFALWSGQGVKKGDVVFVSISESAKPFLPHLQRSILEAGAHMLLNYMPDGLTRDYLEMAAPEQIDFVPKAYLLERVKLATHFVGIISEYDKHELEGVDGKKIMRRGELMKFYMDARRAKEDAGELTWTLALYGTEAMAKEVNMTEEEYWNEIIKACYLDEKDPIKKWQDLFVQIESTKDKLNALPIESVHVKGPDADLHVKLGKDRKWLGGSGRNIPSFELFISPDWRGTNGWIRFSEPLYRYGNLIEGVELEFKDGVVVKSSAKKNEQIIKDMIAVKNADKIGEFSLTDSRYSRITKFMGETLFDENVGGRYGNTHLALGSAYRDSFVGDPKSVSDEKWAEMGFNDSSVHTDIVSTKDRTVTATLTDGTQKVIYQDGKFTV